MAEISNHYQTLGLDESATDAEIKRSYRALVRELHPDLNRSSPSSLLRFQAVQDAYEVLSNPHSRSAYTRLRNTGGASGEERATEETASGAATSREAGAVEIEVRLTFEEALAGGSRLIEVPGAEPVSVPVPKGVRSGVKVRIRGASSLGGATVYAVFRVSASPRFRREGNDLHVTESITVMDALLGTSRSVYNAYGRRMAIRIAPGTQPFERLRVRGQGVQTASSTGDLYVEVQVTVPRSLTDEQRATLQRCVRDIGLL